jgi:hypothetical protein
MSPSINSSIPVFLIQINWIVSHQGTETQTIAVSYNLTSCFRAFVVKMFLAMGRMITYHINLIVNLGNRGFHVKHEHKIDFRILIGYLTGKSEKT